MLINQIDDTPTALTSDGSLCDAADLCMAASNYLHNAGLVFDDDD